MKSKTLHLISIMMVGWNTFPTFAQNFSSSSNLKPQPTADRVVPFRLSDEGITHKYVEWGADIAWLDENNLRRSAAFMGKDNLDVVRTSFQPDLAIVDGKLQQGTIDTLQMRVDMLKWVKPDVKLMINCDAPFMGSYYLDENGANTAHWAEIIDLSTKYYQDAGYEVVSVAPYNEPDYLYNNQGSPNETKRKAEFAEIVAHLKQKERFKGIRMCGGNTLNTDFALPWYNYLKDGLDDHALWRQIDISRQELNKELPPYSQITKVVLQNEEFEKTAKKSIKRYLYQNMNP